MNSSAQALYEFMPISGVNTKNDDIACSLIDGSLLFMSNSESDLVNDFKWNSPKVFSLYKAKRGDTFDQWSEKAALHHSTHVNDEGPASYDSVDSILYFSSVDKYDHAEGSNLKIYSRKFNGDTWGEPQLLPFSDKNADYTHPNYDPSQKLLVFSSNRQGGQGAMDIWFCYKIENGWSDPVNPGIGLNTGSNEIFPSVFEGDIYYSSDFSGGLGGYDFKKALGVQQWKASVALEPPFNSDGDDLSLLFMNDEKAIFSSNRKGGIGGDDMYIAHRKPLSEELHHYTARLKLNGRGLSGAGVVATNEYQEVIFNQQTDTSGTVDIAALRLNQSYRFQLKGVEKELLSDCILGIYDAKQNLIRELRFNYMGFADLELLPLNYSHVNLLSLEDQSLLTISIEGQLFDENPGDVGSAEPVTILDDAGNPVAIAYTNERGKFRFTKVEPQMEYTFRLALETAASNMLIMERGEKITLPVLDAEVNYKRVSASDAIELVNEYNERIVVSAKDIFVINRIYYSYNSAQLTAEAKRQLDQLEILMERNKDVKLELKSHTDSRGNDTYNLNLSSKRAMSVVDYLTVQGLDRSRFKAKGCGETELLNECDDDAMCSDPEHSINRRTEIKLIKPQ